MTSYTSHVEPVIDGRFSSHSHRLDMIEVHSFVLAWDLYLEQVGRRLVTVLAHQRKDACIHVPLCAVMCAVVCASLLRGEVLTDLPSNVADSDSQ